MSDQEREEMSIIALTDEQGNEVEFELLDVVPYNGQEYIAIIPVAEDDEESQMVQLYRIVPDEDGESETYMGLESEEELDAVYALPYMRSTEACYINKTYVEQLGFTIPEDATVYYTTDGSEPSAINGTVYTGQEIELNFTTVVRAKAFPVNPMYHASEITTGTYFINKYHDRIYSIHLKDKTGKNTEPANTNQVWGQGETPLKEVLNLLKDNKWPIYCDIELEYEIKPWSNAVKELGVCVRHARELLM